MIGTTISAIARSIRTLLLIVTVAGLVAACGEEGTSDSFTVTTSPTGTDGEVLAEVNPGDADVEIDPSDTDIEIDPGDTVVDGGGDAMLGTATLDQVVAQPLNGEPINDGLDQVEADLLNNLGSPDSDPFSVSDEDTVESLLQVVNNR